MGGRAKKRKNRNFGHLNGVKTVKKIVESSGKLKIPILTFYVFSTENWSRPKSEINFLFNLIVNYFEKELDNVIANGIKINIFGKIDRMPTKIKVALKRAVKLTEKNNKIIVNLAINYGSKDEIVYAFKKIKNSMNIRSVEKNLFTKNLPFPDILIRTGGHKRLIILLCNLLILKSIF